jgi:hypothetical protein
MYLFNRSTTVDRNHQFDGLAAAIEVAALVSAKTDIPVSVYGARFGAPLNSVMWSARYESHAQMQGVQEQLLADGEYLEWVNSHSELFEVAASDRLSKVVSATLAATPKRFYTLLEATAVSGRYGEAMAIGVRAQEMVARLTGLATAFCAEVYGTMGRVVWLTGADSMDELDSMVAVRETNAEYHALLTEAAPLYIAGSGLSSLIEKLN